MKNIKAYSGLYQQCSQQHLRQLASEVLLPLLLLLHLQCMKHAHLSSPEDNLTIAQLTTGWTLGGLCVEGDSGTHATIMTLKMCCRPPGQAAMGAG